MKLVIHHGEHMSLNQENAFPRHSLVSLIINLLLLTLSIIKQRLAILEFKFLVCNVHLRYLYLLTLQTKKYPPFFGYAQLPQIRRPWFVWFETVVNKTQSKDLTSNILSNVKK